MSIYSKLDRPIVIVRYDPSWPALYQDEHDRLRLGLGERIAVIEHFGSTAIPGLAAKPVIDIAIGISQLEQASNYLTALERLDYTYVPELEAVLPDRRFLWRVAHTGQRYHINLAELDGPLWENPLRFREYLRQHPDEAAQYAQLKARLAGQCGSDIGAYIQAKTEFVEQILRKAKWQAASETPTHRA